MTWLEGCIGFLGLLGSSTVRESYSLEGGFLENLEQLPVEHDEY